ncbi:SGNH/GDSL hydrolase family protein [bacterium]|nr:SGNH/GDSL hydrolase family protein [bacterium]
MYNQTSGPTYISLAPDDKKPKGETEPKKAGKRGNKTVNILIGVGVFVVVLLLLEFFSWLFVCNTDMQLRGLYVAEGGSWHLKSGWSKCVKGSEFSANVHINAEGRREMPELPLIDQFSSSQVKQLAATGEDRGTIRRPGVGQTILALGDSFAFGSWANAEDTWLNQIQRVTGAKVVNCAFPQAGTGTMLNLYKKLDPSQRKADIVLVTFYTGNDFYENMLGDGSFTISDGLLVLTPKAEARWNKYNCLLQQNTASIPKSNEISWYRPLLRRSHFWQWMAAPSGKEKILTPNVSEAWYLQGYTKEMKEGVDKTLKQLDELQKLCAEHGSTLVIAVVPSKTEVYDKDWEKWLESHNFNEELFDRHKPRSIILDWAESKGVYAVDLLPSLVNRQRLYFEKDEHFNAWGHFQVGEVVSQFLDRNGIFDLNMSDTTVDSANSNSNQNTESMPEDDVEIIINSKTDKGVAL